MGMKDLKFNHVIMSFGFKWTSGFMYTTGSMKTKMSSLVYYMWMTSYFLLMILTYYLRLRI